MTEDGRSPVVKALQRAAAAPGGAAAALAPLHPGRKLPPGGTIEVQSSSWAGDLAQLMCASHLVMARSSLSSLLLLNPRLRHAYLGDFPGDLDNPKSGLLQLSSSVRPLHGAAFTGACGTSVHVAKALPYAYQWLNSQRQRQELVERRWEGAFAHVPVLPAYCGVNSATCRRPKAPMRKRSRL